MGWFSRFSRLAGVGVPEPTKTGPCPTPTCRFVPLPGIGGPVKGLVLDGVRYHFSTYLEIGRDEGGRVVLPGQLLVPNASVSWRHCIITQSSEGLCLVRDVSHNGTRLDGRRLVPNVETEMRPGQTLDLGPGLRFTLEAVAGDAVAQVSTTRGRTKTAPNLTLATVLVGDIRNYTALVRGVPAAVLQQSVSRVFEALTVSVVELGGTVKEFPGDAILTFWEGNFHGRMALSACRAAIALDRLTRRIAADRSAWVLPDYPLRMDWGLATGTVSIDSFGGKTPIGLSLVGEPVVLACRIEKFATDRTGPILACPRTRDLAERALREETANGASVPGAARVEFTDLGEMQAEGFVRAEHVFAVSASSG